MLPPRRAIISGVLLLLAAWMAPWGQAQRSQRRVLTNEDVARPAPPPPAAAPSASEAAPAPEAAKTAPAPVQPATAPRSELQRALERQAFLRDAIEEFNEKYDKETIEARKQRWDTMVNALNTLIQYNQLLINELQEQQAGSPPAGEPTP